MPASIRVKRIYDLPQDEDGARFLVDRLWPRGVSKDKARLAAWLKALAPSETVRREYHGAGDQPDEAWLAFRLAYFAELDRGGADIAAALAELQNARSAGQVTLLFGARNETRNNAVALVEWLER